MIQKWLIVGLCILFLGSCAQQFAIPFLDNFMLWKLERYVKLTPQQKNRTEAHIQELLAHVADHDANTLLEEIETTRHAHQNNDIDRAWVTAQGNRLERLFRHLREEVYEVLVQELPHLSDKQVDELMSSLQDDLEDDREDLSDKGEQERLSDRSDKYTETVEEFIGPLTRSQERIVRRLMAETPEFEDEWMKHRQDWLDYFEETLAVRNGAEFEERLRIAITNPESIQSAELQAMIEESRQNGSNAILPIREEMTERQKSHFNRALSQREDQIHSFIKAFGTE